MLARSALFAAVLGFGLYAFTDDFLAFWGPVLAFLGVAIALPVLLTPPPADPR